MRTIPFRARRRSAGFAMVTVVFLLVGLAGIVAAVVSLSTRGNQATVLDVRQARATSAARAALQWAAWQILDPRGTLAPGISTLPGCFASPATVALPASLADYAVSVTCSRSPDPAATPSDYQEDQKHLAIYKLTATATAGTAGSSDRVERRLEMSVESCKDPAGNPPDYHC